MKQPQQNLFGTESELLPDAQQTNMLGNNFSVLLPDVSFLLQGHYEQVGFDLVVTNPSGQAFVVEDYFSFPTPPNLMISGGAGYNPEMVLAKLHLSRNTQFAGPGDGIGIGEEIGEVSLAVGKVIAKRAGESRPQRAAAEQRAEAAESRRQRAEEKQRREQKQSRRSREQRQKQRAAGREAAEAEKRRRERKQSSRGRAEAAESREQRQRAEAEAEEAGEAERQRAEQRAEQRQRQRQKQRRRQRQRAGAEAEAGAGSRQRSRQSSRGGGKQSRAEVVRREGEFPGENLDPKESSDQRVVQMVVRRVSRA